MRSLPSLQLRRLLLRSLSTSASPSPTFNQTPVPFLSTNPTRHAPNPITTSHFLSLPRFSLTSKPFSSSSSEPQLAQSISSHLLHQPQPECADVTKTLQSSFPNVTPTPSLVLSVLNLSAEAGRAFLGFNQWLIHNPRFDHTDETLSYFVDYFGRRKDFKATHDVILSSRDVAGPKTLAASIDRLVRAGRPAQAVSMFEKMEEEYGIKRDKAALRQKLKIEKGNRGPRNLSGTMKDPLVRTKVLVRHLPPSLSQSDFFQQIDHLFGDRHNWFCFRPGKNSHKHQRYSRAYIEFKRPEDVFEFAEFFDGHVFVNEKGTQFKSIVEYAPSQRVPKPSNKKDGREGTINKDPDYLEFLKLIAKPAEHLPSAEIQLERKEAEQAGAAKEAPIVTPLMEYIRQKRAVGSGTQISSVVRKVRRRTGAASFSKRGSTSTKRVSEKKKYILKDTAKYTSRKDRSTFNVLPRREDQLASSSGKDTMGNEIGSVSGIPVIADSGRTKILLKRETPPAPEGITQHQASIGSSLVSASPKQNQRRDASGRFLRSILSHNEVRQREASAEVQSQQKILGPNSDIKRVPRPSNARLGLNNETNSMSSEGDRRRVMVDKFTKKDMHGTTNISEKQDRHTRNKDRPDRGVWTPLRRAESSHNSDEHLSSSASQRPQLLSDSVEVPHGEVKADTSYGSRTGEVPTGSNRHFGRRGTASSMKDDGCLNTSEGKSSKRGAAAAVHGAPEKQVWVQKSSGS